MTGMSRSPSSSQASANGDPLRDFLLSQRVPWLVDELLAAAEASPLLRARFEKAAGADAIVDVSRILRRLDRAAEITDYIRYQEATSFAYGIGRELDAAQELREQGFGGAAIEVLEYAIELMEESLGNVDDSDGEVGGVLATAQEMHAQACIEARPDPVELAERLAPWALRSDCEVFLDSPSSHAEALGEAGLARFSEIVDAAAGRPSAVQDDDDDVVGASSFTVRHLREQLAAHRGTDALIEVMADDLSSAYQFHRIATLLAGDERIDEALEWLKRGKAHDFGWTDDRLDELAADLHRRAGRFELATGMVAERFARSPSVAGYERLRDFAIDSGEWDGRRAEALRVLRALPTATAAAPGSRNMHEQSGHGILVQVLLGEGDIDGAWEAARRGGCSSSIWIELAGARGVNHPADAIPVFQRVGAGALEGGNRSAYSYGASLIQRAHRLAVAAGLADASASWIAGIREQNRRRPALQDEFNRHGLPRVR